MMHLDIVVLGVQSFLGQVSLSSVCLKLRAGVAQACGIKTSVACEHGSLTPALLLEAV